MTSKAEQLKRLRDEFIAEFSSELDALAGALLQSKLSPDHARDAVKQAGSYFHRLSGVAETFGMATLGRLAAVIDGMVDLSVEWKPEVFPRLAHLIAMAVEATRDSFREASPHATQESHPSNAEVLERIITEPIFEGGKRATVAIVDDDRLSGQIIENCLSSAGYSTVLLSNPHLAVEQLSQRLPDLILLDVAMPGLDGFQLCEQLRQNPALALVPIVFVTAKNDTAQKVRGLSVGGNDYIEKPFSPDELVARIAAHLERLRTIRDLAIRDSLTGVFNHKYFVSLVEQELSRAGRYGLPLSLALLDIDHFKTINDSHGHLAGDAVLGRFVRVVTGQLRTTDFVGRWGGDEFAVLLTQTPVPPATGVMKRIVLAVSNIIVPNSDPPLRVTTSIGVANYKSGEDLPSFVARADAALYQAKHKGRSRVECADE